MNLERLEHKEKISVQECKKILNKQGENFSDEEVKSIRDFLYTLIEIDYFHFQKYVKAKAERLLVDEAEGKVIQLNEINESTELRQTG
jgi:hypothetical protein